MASAYAKVERYKQIISILFEEYEIKCYFCNEQLTGESFYRNKSGKSMDEICWHHLDGNHSNDIKGNRRFAHRTCHLKFHRQKEKAERERVFNETMKKLGINKELVCAI